MTDDNDEITFTEAHSDTTPEGKMAPAVCAAKDGHVWRCERCGVSPKAAELI